MEGGISMAVEIREVWWGGVSPASVGQKVGAFLRTVGVGVACVFVLGFVMRVGRVSGVIAGLTASGSPLAAIWIIGADRRGTCGMRMVGLRFGTVQGGPIGFWRCLGRIVLGVILVPVLPVSAWMAARDRLYRTLADLVCGTAVWVEPREGDDGVSRGFEVMPLEERQHL